MFPILIFFSFISAVNDPAIYYFGICGIGTNTSCHNIQATIVADQIYRGEDHQKSVDLAHIGVTVDGGFVEQKFSTGNNVGSRVFVKEASRDAYFIFNMTNAHLEFDVNLSEIQCGMNAAVYLVEMPANGVTILDNYGANFGGGYCDANFLESFGCGEIDISEANAHASVFTIHECNGPIGFKGRIECDSMGISSNPYLQDQTLYGNGSQFTIDTSKTFKVTLDSAKQNGMLERSLVQNNKTVTNTLPISENVRRSLLRGHVLAFSLWASDGDMSWMDGGTNGHCSLENESSEYLQNNFPDATVTYSKLVYLDCSNVKCF